MARKYPLSLLAKIGGVENNISTEQLADVCHYLGIRPDAGADPYAVRNEIEREVKEQNKILTEVVSALSMLQHVGEVIVSVDENDVVREISFRLSKAPSRFISDVIIKNFDKP
jgi:hypothetical protein